MPSDKKNKRVKVKKTCCVSKRMCAGCPLRLVKKKRRKPS